MGAASSKYSIVGHSTPLKLRRTKIYALYYSGRSHPTPARPIWTGQMLGLTEADKDPSADHLAGASWQ